MRGSRLSPRAHVGTHPIAARSNAAAGKIGYRFGDLPKSEHPMAEPRTVNILQLVCQDDRVNDASVATWAIACIRTAHGHPHDRASLQAASK